MLSEFADEYDLSSLHSVSALGRTFSMEVTSRYRHRYERDGYEAFTADVMSRIFTRARVFVDVGAHYGFFTLLAATTNPELEVLALEPVSETFAALERNVARSGAEQSGTNQSGPKRVTLYRAAASDVVGMAPFIISSASENCSFHPHPLAPPLRTIEVETATIDALLEANEPCPLVVKIATDGHELSVLRGMADTLRRFEDVTLIVEFNPKMLRAAGCRPQRFLKELSRLGFETFLLDDSLRRAYRMGPRGRWSALMDSDGHANLYCVRRSRALSVCFFSHTDELGGAERSLLELVDELVADHGVICSVVLPSRGPLFEALERVGAGCLVSPYAWWCRSDDDQLTDAELRRRVAASVAEIIDNVHVALTRIDPDIVWSQTLVIPWGAVAASLARKHHVWSICEYGERDHGFRFVSPFDRIVADIARSSDLIYACARSVADHLFPSASSDRVRVLYRHVAVSSPVEDVRHGLFARTNSVKLGIFATLVESKGHEDVIRAAGALVAQGHDVELLVAGREFERYGRHLHDLVTVLEIADRVRFCGFLSDPFPAMRACDIIVVCSRNEAFGRVAIEGMLLAKPVVYAAAGGMLETMIDGETGVSYPPGDVSRLVARLDELMAAPERGRALGERARNYAAERFSREAYGGKVFRELLELRSQPVKRLPAPSAVVASLSATGPRAGSTSELRTRFDALQRSPGQVRRRRDKLKAVLEDHVVDPGTRHLTTLCRAARSAIKGWFGGTR